MRQRDAFVAGYAPSAASPYFSSLALLAEASRGADAALLQRIGEESDRVVALRDAAADQVERAEEAMRGLGTVPPPRPMDAEEYPEWVEAVFAGVQAALAPGSTEAVTHLLGHVLGEAMATLDALAVLGRIQEAAPDHLLMRVQGQSLEHERATGERRLGKLAAHPALGETVRNLTATAAQRSRPGGSAQALADLAAEMDTVL